MIGAGLCAGCRHARVNHTRRGPSYLRCQLASVDEAYPRYPRLPVLSCAGYRPAEVPNTEQQSTEQQSTEQQGTEQQG
ncbi:MAG: hypothetical protein ABI047_12735 [Jatrophihabitantaceae bacterium]